MSNYSGNFLFSIQSNKCLTCPLPVCTKVCPVSAIRKTNIAVNKYVIDNKRCIACGDCYVFCPNDAVQFRNSIDEVKNLIKDYNTVALLDPSISGEFEDITDYRKFVTMIKSLGFNHVHEVSFGVDMVAEKYADLINNYRGKYYIFSTCPVIVNYVRKFHPLLIKNLAPFVSPSIALARYLRKLYDDNTKYIFIGPCIASKDEEVDAKEKYIDANITFRELRQMFMDSDIKEIEVEYDNFDSPYGNKGAMYPLVDGLLYAADCEKSPVFSMANRRKSLDAVKTFAEQTAKLQKHFNLFYCQCCALGPGTTGGDFIMSDNAVRLYAKKRSEALDIQVWKQNLADASKVDLNTSFTIDDQRRPEPPINKINQVLNIIGHNTKKCQRCGYISCFEFARNVAKGHVNLDVCTVYEIEKRDKNIYNLITKNSDLLIKNDKLLKDNNNANTKINKLEDKTQQQEILLNNLNAGIVIVDNTLTIIEANRMFINMLGEDIIEIADIVPELKGGDLKSMVPEQLSKLFNNVIHFNENIVNKDMMINNKLYNVSIYPMGKGNIAGGIIRDMHLAVIQKEQVINKINEVINENLVMVQKIGFLLGESAAKTEKQLNSVINTYNVTENKENE